MARVLLDNDRYRLETRIWSRWVLTDKATGAAFRLDDEEDALIDKFARHLKSLWATPDFAGGTKKQKIDHAQAVLSDLAPAIIQKRQGDSSTFIGLADMNHDDFISFYAWRNVFGGSK